MTVGVAAGVPTQSRRDKGGRRERDDWALFDRELSRRAALDGGHLDRRTFTREMKEWAARNMVPLPDLRTIERRISARASDEMFLPE